MNKNCKIVQNCTKLYKIVSVIVLMAVTGKVYAQTGYVGINTGTPTNTLHVKPLPSKAAENPLRVEEIKEIRFADLKELKESTNKVLAIDEEGVVRKIDLDVRHIPRVAIFALENNMPNFLLGKNSNSRSPIQMKMVANSIEGLIYDMVGPADGATRIYFPNGVYTIDLYFDGDHNGGSNCTITSFFADFYPISDLERLHFTAAHQYGSASNFGASVSHTKFWDKKNKVIKNGKNYNYYDILIGRGISQSGANSSTGCGTTAVNLSGGGRTFLRITQFSTVGGDVNDPSTITVGHDGNWQ